MWEFDEAVSYYRSQGAPKDQQMLIALLKEAMQETGPLTQEMLDRIARAFGLAPSVLNALVRCVPGLRMAAHPHRLEICSRCGAKLAAWIESAYHVKNGGACDMGGFTFHVTGCMKNCKAGPSLRWDGVLYPRADEALVRRLTGCSSEAEKP